MKSRVVAMSLLLISCLFMGSLKTMAITTKEQVRISLDNVYLENGYGQPSQLFDQQDKLDASNILQSEIAETSWISSLYNKYDVDAICFIDLGQEYQIEGLFFHQNKNVDFTLYSGHPNDGWQELTSWSDKSTVTKKWHELPLAEAVTTRYLRIKLGKASKGVDEFSFYGRASDNSGKAFAAKKIELSPLSVTNVYGKIEKFTTEVEEGKKKNESCRRLI